VFGVDAELLRDGTYFLIEGQGVLLAAGGWSRRRTLYGGDHSVSGRVDGPMLEPSRDAARIRAFFVDPAHSRQAWGTPCSSPATTRPGTRVHPPEPPPSPVCASTPARFQPWSGSDRPPDGLQFSVIRMVRRSTR
jgi:hypothetical protein